MLAKAGAGLVEVLDHDDIALQRPARVSETAAIVRVVKRVQAFVAQIHNDYGRYVVEWHSPQAAERVVAIRK